MDCGVCADDVSLNVVTALKKLAMGGVAAGAAVGTGKALGKKAAKEAPKLKTNKPNSPKYNSSGKRSKPEIGLGTKKNPVKGKLNARPGQWYKDINGKKHLKLN